jgi:hypothetical protein
MGDYLENLAARALRIAPLLRPRPASRFESASPERAELSPPGLSPRLLAVAERPAPEALAASESAREAPPDATTHVSAPRTPAPPPDPAERLVADGGEVRPPGPASPADARRRADPGARGAPEQPRAAPPRRPLDRPRAVFRPRAIRRTAPEPAAPNAPANEPPVRVTIGRIEVRAVTPPAPQPRPRPERPGPLSLNDYLEQRREGRR